MSVTAPALPRSAPHASTASFRTRLVAAGALYIAATALAAQPLQGAKKDPGGAGAKASPPPSCLTIYSAGFDGCLKSPKDAWMKQSLESLEKSGIDLPPAILSEIGKEVPLPLVGRLIMDLIGSRMMLTAGVDMSQGQPAPQVQMTFFGNERRTGAAVKPDVEAVLKASGMWSQFKPAPGSTSLSMAPIGPPDQGMTQYFGTMDFGGKPATVYSVGKMPAEPEMKFERFGLPAGMQPQVAFELDFKPLQPLLGPLAQMAAQPGGKSPLESMNIVGDNPIMVRAAMGNDGKETLMLIRLVNGAALVKPADLLTLDAKDLQWIPKDAAMASVSKSDMAKSLNEIVDNADMALAAMGTGEDGFDDGGMDGKKQDGGGAKSQGVVESWCQQHFGVDLRKGVIAPLGNTTAFYRSDSTGGGGIFSYVSVNSLRDEATMKQTLATVAKRLNEMAAPLQGVVSLQKRQSKACDCLYTVTIASLPIPVAPTIAVGKGALILSLDPQAALGALAQTEAKSSLADNADFKAIDGAKEMAGASSLKWMDTPANLRSGYGAAVAFGALMSNLSAKRNTDEAPLDPMVPSYNELAAGAKASITTTRVDGKDVLIRSRADPSFTVNLAGVAGESSLITVAGGAIAAGLLLPAMAKGRAAAREAQAGEELRQLCMSIQVFAADNKDHLPPDLDALVKKGMLPAVPKVNPREDGLDGSFTYHRPAVTLAMVHEPSRVAVVWENYSNWPRGGVLVGFADGHVEKVASESALRAMEHNSIKSKQ